MWLVEKGTLVAGVVTYPYSPESLLRSGDEIRQSIFSVGLDFHSIPSIFSSPRMSIIAVNMITHTALEPPALSHGSFDLHGVDGLAPLIRDDDLRRCRSKQACWGNISMVMIFSPFTCSVRIPSILFRAVALSALIGLI